MAERKVDILINFKTNMGKIQKQINEPLKKIIKSQDRFTENGRRLAANERFLRKEMSGGAQQLINNATNINKLGQKHNSFGKVMRMNQEQWSKFNKEGGEFNRRSAKMANSIRRVTHGLRGFRMEMLGVMFFGMGMVRMFKGIITPALQMSGAMQLLSNVLGIMFLPFGLKLIDFAIWLLSAWQNLSPGWQKFINFVIAGGMAIGLFLQIFGTLALGIGSFILALGTLIAVLKFFAIGLLLVIGIAALMGATWDDAKGVAEGFNSTLQEQDGIFQKLKTTLSNFWDELNKNETFNTFTTAWAKMWKSVAEDPIMGTFINVFPTLMKNKWDRVFSRDIPNAIDKTKGKLKEMHEKLRESESFVIYENFWNSLVQLWNSTVRQAMEKVIGWLTSIINLVNKLPTWLLNIIGGAIVGFVAGGPVGAAVGATVIGLSELSKSIGNLSSDIQEFKTFTPFIIPGGITPEGTISAGGTINIDITNNIAPTSDVDVENLSVTMAEIIIEQLNRMGFYPIRG